MNELEETRRCFFLAGMRSNARGVLREAIDTASRHGYESRILDVVGLVPRWKPYPNEWEALGLEAFVIRLTTWSELDRFSRRAIDRRTVLISLFPPNRHMRPIWRRLHRRGASMGVIMVGPIPSGPVKALRRIGIAKWISGMSRRLKSIFKPRPDFWIVSGSECLRQYRSYFRTLKGTREIHAHSIDYEIYAYGSRDAAVDGRNVNVFLDQGWFTKPRPDHLPQDGYPPTCEDRYRPTVRMLLRRVKELTGHPVVVSCHPKADLEATRLLYEGFEVHQGNTVEWVRSASLVIANTSTSIQYAVLFDKPLLLFTNDELNGSFLRTNLDGYQQELDAPVVNVDSLEGLEGALQRTCLARRNYARYIARYIKQPDSPARPLWDIVFGALGD